MYLLISQKDRSCYLAASPIDLDGFSRVAISSKPEVSPLVVWQSDGSIDYLETNKFGDVIRRELVWYPFRFFERPIVYTLGIKLPGVPHSRVAMNRLKRLIDEGRTFLEYIPPGVSIYYDARPGGQPFYRMPSSNTKGYRYLSAVTGQKIPDIGSEIEEIRFIPTYRPYPSSSRRFNFVLIHRPSEKGLYLFNAVSGNLLSSIHTMYDYEHNMVNRIFSLGVFCGEGLFFRPNPNMCRRFCKNLPTGSLKNVKKVNMLNH